MDTYIVTMNSVMFTVNGVGYLAHQDNPNFRSIVDACLAGNFVEARDLVNVGVAIEDFFEGNVSVVGGSVFYKDRVVENSVCHRILHALKNRLSPKPLMRFLDKLMQNPSMNSVKQLYNFLNHNGIPINDDGNILAYKAVRSDLLDKHSATIKNEIGKTISVPRNEVSDDPHSACSFGLHVGALSYVRDFASRGDRIIICEVDPANVVSVPNDANGTKMRVCEYKVLSFFEGELPDYFVSSEGEEEESEDTRDTLQYI